LAGTIYISFQKMYKIRLLLPAMYNVKTPFIIQFTLKCLGGVECCEEAESKLCSSRDVVHIIRLKAEEAEG
jgi:hypothetical protein